MGILPFESPERVFGNRALIFKKKGGLCTLYTPRLGQASKGRRVSLLKTSKNRGIAVHWVSRHLPWGSGDFGSPSREPGGRGRLWTEEGVVGRPSWGKGRVSSLGWAGRLANSEGPGFVLLRASSPSQIWELVGAFGRSWPTRQGYIRILSGKPEGGGSSDARLPAPANGEACTVGPWTPGPESTLCHVQAW